MFKRQVNNFYHTIIRDVLGVVFSPEYHGGDCQWEWPFHLDILIRELQKFPSFIIFEEGMSQGNHVYHALAEELSFLNKGALREIEQSSGRKPTSIGCTKGRFRCNFDCQWILEDFGESQRAANNPGKLISDKGIAENQKYSLSVGLKTHRQFTLNCDRKWFTPFLKKTIEEQPNFRSATKTGFRFRYFKNAKG